MSYVPFRHSGHLACLCGLLAWAAWSCSEAADPEPPPNIIFILADDLGYGDLGAYGQTRIQTPRLDQMAAEGMRFTQHYAGSTVCAPSRCVLMTGQHTGHATIRGNGGPPLPATDHTVAEALRQAGYRTGLIGKWGLGTLQSSGHPLKQGFDYFFGFLSQTRAHNYYPAYIWEDTTRVDLDNEVIMADRGYAKGVGSAATKKETYVHDLFTEKALDFVRAADGQPFFLYLAYTIPHANNEYWLTADHGMEIPDYGRYVNADWPEAQKGTAAMITHLDRDVGRLLDLLKQMGVDDQTVVFFSSDNGPHAEGENDPEFFDSNGPFRGMKRDLYEGGIRVPLLVRWPGTVAPGQTSDHLSAFWDFLPTASEIAGLEPPAEVDGISMLPELRGESQPVHDHLYWAFYEQGGRQAIRMDHWKGVRYGINENPGNPLELYNLSEDPGEEHDLAEDHPALVEALNRKMTAAHQPDAHFRFAYERGPEE